MDDSIMLELFSQNHSALVDACKTPMLITWTDESSVYQTKKILVSIQEFKYTTLSDISVVINTIPAGTKVLFWVYEDKVDFNAMTQEVKDSVRFILYYNTDDPINLIPDMGTYEVVFFMGKFAYPEKVKIVGKKV